MRSPKIEDFNRASFSEVLVMRKSIQVLTLAAFSVVFLSGCPRSGVELPKDSGVAFDKARDADTLQTGGAPENNGKQGTMNKKPLPAPPK
jgi:hypothetical protein